MTCRHSKYDPACSSYQAQMGSLERDYQTQIAAKREPATPDAKNYFVEDAMEVGRFLVLKVKYPNCKDCSYEGTKVMVFEGASLLDAIRWKEIDPHFRDKAGAQFAAPGPVARFPASPQGWQDAITYAKGRA